MKILVTGAAGFIGFHTAKRLLEDGHDVIGFDSVSDYYDVQLKYNRLKKLERFDRFKFIKNLVENQQAIETLFRDERPQRVVHLAAQAGVRYSIDHPDVYIQGNIVGFQHILEGCRHHGVEHLVFASSSSVYGMNTHYPFSVSDNVDHPISLYAATKKSNELTAHAYAHLYRLPVTGLRFFTVYGPWGRPDMALFLFTKNILEGKPIDVYNHGNMVRDFTYIDDIIEGVVRVLMKVPAPDPNWSGDNPDPSSSSSPYRLYNIGSNNPVQLMDFIKEIELNLGLKAIINMMPMQPGDVRKSHADVENLLKDHGYVPKFDVKNGIKNFIEWYLDYYQVKKTSPMEENPV